MPSLAEYVQKVAERGSCECGQCIDAPPDPKQPAGHTADVHFFKVRANEDADAETLRSLVTNHIGEFNRVDLFDGTEHGYMELGGWIGDQGLALTLMGLGKVLGLWDLMTPRSMGITDEGLAASMAGGGMVTVKAVSP